MLAERCAADRLRVRRGGVALPTAVLSTHTGGFENYVIHDMTPQMRAFAAHWKRMNAKFDCVYTGFSAPLSR